MCPPTRRDVLRAVGALAAVGTAGCVGTDGVERVGRDALARLPDGGRVDPPLRAEGEPVEAEQSFADDPGYGDGVEYVPSTRTVRFVATRDGDGPVSYDTWSFAEWGRIHTGKVALARARDVTSDRLGTDAFGSGVGTPPEEILTTASFVPTLSVSASETADDSSVTVAELARAAPRTVETTVSLEGDTFDRSVPVFVDRFTATRL